MNLLTEWQWVSDEMIYPYSFSVIALDGEPSCVTQVSANLAQEEKEMLDPTPQQASDNDFMALTVHEESLNECFRGSLNSLLDHQH